jgi:hypothetical protein
MVTKKNMHLIIKVQSIIRRLLTRIRTKQISDSYMVRKTSHFSKEESAETLNTKDPFDWKTQPTVRSHTYASGAEYRGYWLGGMRHGQGTMEWADGSSYEGNWEYNTAFGKGVYRQSKGGWYDGDFVANLCCG